MSKEVSKEFVWGHETGYKEGLQHQSQGELAQWVNSLDDKSKVACAYKQRYDREWTDSHKTKSDKDLSASLLAHVVETFGTEQTARRWLISECGALNNRTPLHVIEDTGDYTTVERVLDCIDYGMIA